MEPCPFNRGKEGSVVNRGAWGDGLDQIENTDVGFW